MFSILLVLLIHDYAFADEKDQNLSEILAVIPAKSVNVDKAVYHQFDKVVPKLKKIAKSKIIKLECRYSGRADRKLDVENAYQLAGRVAKYLRVKHKLDLDLWISIDLTSNSLPPVFTIAVFSDSVKDLNAVLIDPQKN